MKREIERKVCYFLALLTVLLLSSCSMEDESINTTAINKSDSYKVTVAEAKSNAMDFISNIEMKTRATNLQSLKISDVNAVSVKDVATRGSSNNTTNLDTLFYVINFQDSCGFVLAAADNRETPIFAYVEHGNFSYNENDTTNLGFNAFISTLIENKVAERESVDGQFLERREVLDDPCGGGGGFSYIPSKFQVMSPLLVTKWGQDCPYNRYCNGCVTGCVMTAASQICSFIEKPNQVSFRDNNQSCMAILNWNLINTESKIHGGFLFPYRKSSDQVAILMRFWGIAFGAKYGKKNTSANTDKAIDKMKFYGFNVTGLSDYNGENVIADLKKGNRIIMMRGNARYYHVGFFFRKYVDGHCWVVDGYIDQVKNNKESRYIHCNWGWNGDRNGYFLENTLNAEQDPVYNDDVTGTRSENFRYKLKTATFIK